MVKIIHIDPGNRIISQVLYHRNLRYMVHLVVLVPELKWYESLKSTCFILLLAQAFHMVYPMPELFYMPIQHCGIGFHAQLMCLLMYIQPLLCVAFIMCNLFPYFRMKDLCTTARHRIKAC